MKKFRKIASLVLAAAMVGTMPVTVFAEGETETTAAVTKVTSAKISTSKDRTFDVYQIFTGDLASNGKLSNLKWGVNGIGSKGQDVDETTINTLTAIDNANTSDADKIKIIEQFASIDTAKKVATVDKDHPYVAATGYYIFRDVTENLGEGETLSADVTLVTAVTGDTIITPKTGTTESGKKVKDTNDSTGETTDWQDSSDYDIGDAVPFELTAKVASDYDHYTKGYKLTFHDVESTGLSFNANSVTVYLDKDADGKVDSTLTKDTDYTVKTSGLTDGCSFEVHFENLKNISDVKAGSVITVEYTSTLNNDAVVGKNGNTNKSNITYTNNPYDEQAGEKGSTPWDNVIVFTYDVEVDKVDQDKKPLTGAEFSLEKFEAAENGTETYKSIKGSWVAKTVIKNDAGTVFTIHGLDDGEYRITEITTPAGYNTADPIYFTVNAEHSVESATPELTSLTGTAVKSDGTAFTDADIQSGKVASFETTLTKTTGKVATTVVNNQGSTLPTTGGMGTTILYVAGAILVIAGAAVLVIKKRHEA